MFPIIFPVVSALWGGLFLGTAPRDLIPGAPQRPATSKEIV